MGPRAAQDGLECSEEDFRGSGGAFGVFWEAVYVHIYKSSRSTSSGPLCQFRPGVLVVFLSAFLCLS